MQAFFHHVRGVFSRADQEPVKTGHAEQTQTHHQHASDRAATEGNGQRGVDARASGLSGAHVCTHRHVHADEARCAREHRAEHEADGGFGTEEEENQYGQCDADVGDSAVLPRQVGLRAGLNGSSDFLHARIAGRKAVDPRNRQDPVENRRCTADERDDEPGVG